jgi:2-dehydropantoate 2-reductase
VNIIILGAGVQGTLYGVRLARAGHSVTLIARGTRAQELRDQGAAIRNAIDGKTDTMSLPVIEEIAPDSAADLCFVFVRREQMDAVIPDLSAAPGIRRIVFMVNHANGSAHLFAALGRERVVLGFPSAAGGFEAGVDVYVDVKEQPTSIDRAAPEIAVIFRQAGFRVDLVTNMDSWLKRHAVFVTAVGGALYRKNCDARLLAADQELVRTFVLAVREGWSALDRIGVAPPPLALRAIFCWVPLPFATAYWRRLLGSARGEYYFAVHTRHAIREMAALADDVRALIRNADAPHLWRLYDAIYAETSRPEPHSEAGR